MVFAACLIAKVQLVKENSYCGAWSLRVSNLNPGNLNKYWFNYVPFIFSVKLTYQTALTSLNYIFILFFITILKLLI